MPRSQPPPAPDPTLLRIRDIVYQISGIFMPDSKMYLLGGSCSQRMRATNVDSLRSYLDQLTVRPNREAELRSLLNDVTIGETCLFRHPSHLDAIRKVVLPQLIASKKVLPVKRLRVWSAGCSTGEEPYTLAMVFAEESQTQLQGWTIEIQATDLNDRSLEAAKKGLYGDYALRNTPEYFRNKYLVKEGEKFVVRDEMKSLISFSRLNLHDDGKMVFMKGIDLIFCCNVLIYFDGVSKSRAIQHFFNALMPGGYLFLGQAESLFRINELFRLVHFPMATAYWKPDSAVLPAGAD